MAELRETKVEIIQLYYKDAWYGERDTFIGMKGYARNMSYAGEWYSFEFRPIGIKEEFSFMYAKVDIIK